MARAKAVLESVTSPTTLRSLRDRRRARPRPLRQRRPSRNSYERRYRQTIRSIDIWSVLKISLCFYLSALLVVLVAGIVLWWIASALGAIHNVEKFIGDLVSDSHFHFLSWEVLRGATLIGLVVVCVLVVITVLAAAFYNLFSELTGGLEVTVVEHEDER
jgi:ABC-type multidrug transport system fused ATPase/permease subunit